MTRLAEIKNRLDRIQSPRWTNAQSQDFDEWAPADIEYLLNQNTRMREALEALVWRYEEVVRDPDFECSLSVSLSDFDLVNARKELEAEQ
jgi:hypothetical protein